MAETAPLTRFDVRFDVEARKLHWQAQQRGREPYESAPVGFTLDIDVGGGASTEDKKRLIEAAAKGCFVEQSLKPGIVKHRLKIGDDWVAV